MIPRNQELKEGRGKEGKTHAFFWTPTRPRMIAVRRFCFGRKSPVKLPLPVGKILPPLSPSCFHSSISNPSARSPCPPPPSPSSSSPPYRSTSKRYYIRTKNIVSSFTSLLKFSNQLTFPSKPCEEMWPYFKGEMLLSRFVDFQGNKVLNLALRF